MAKDQKTKRTRQRMTSTQWIEAGKLLSKLVAPDKPLSTKQGLDKIKEQILSARKKEVPVETICQALEEQGFSVHPRALKSYLRPFERAASAGKLPDQPEQQLDQVAAAGDSGVDQHP